MRRRFCLPRVITVVLVLAMCLDAMAQSALEEGEIRDGVYVNESLGWTMPVPEGWSVMSRERAEALEARGKESVEDTIGEEVDAEGLVDLLQLQMDERNVFQSTSEPFEEAYEGEWGEVTIGVRDVVIDTYLNAGLEVEYTDIMSEEVGGIPFEYFQLVIYTADGQPLLGQTMYSTLRRGFDFGASLTYDNDADRDTMLRAWRASTFSAPH